MRRIAVLGGGPAGAMAADRLAAGGCEVTLFDEKLAWEKPCGGGLTARAWERYPFLLDASRPGRPVTEVILGAAGTGRLRLVLDKPIVVYSRRELNGLLLERAAKAGVRVEKTRALGLERRPGGWLIRTKDGDHRADFCVVATGARNSPPGAGSRFSAGEVMLALGYHVPGEAREIVLEFLPGAEGYMWVFPRSGHLAAGICARSRSAAALRSALESFLRERSIAFDGGAFYAHPIPSLPAGSWRDGRIAGDGWVAAGDAAGFVDPITGEGIYYALRSGELAAEALLAADGDAGRASRAYRTSVWEDFAADLEYAARIAHRFYAGRFLCGPFTTRMIQFSRRSAAVRGVMQDLVAGAQPYRELKSRLRANARRAALEIAASFFSPRRLSLEP